MISEWLAIFLLFIVGVIFDRAILLIIQAKHTRNLTILLLTMLNNLVIFLTLAVVYYVHGFTVIPDYGEGWLDWVTLVEGFIAAYLPISASFVYRVVMQKEM